MEKYHRHLFTKFLPVKGDVRPYNSIVMSENGVCIIWGGKSRHNLQAYGEFGAFNNPYVKNIPNLRPAKLFVCSNNIKQGEDFYNPNNGKIYNAKEVIGDSNSNIYNIYPWGKEKLGFTNTEVFKIIGEVSEDAIWINEGDELHYDDIEKQHETEDKKNKHLEVGDVVLVTQTNFFSQIEGEIKEFKPTIETNGDAWGWNDPVLLTNVKQYTLEQDDTTTMIELPDMEVTREIISFKPIPYTICKVLNKTCKHFH